MKRRFPILAILIALSALSASAAWAGNAKVKVCHIPPGNPANFHTITISENALQAHLGHGDLAGACFAHCDTLCSDDNACTIDACDASETCLISHPPVNCDDGNLCTTDSCNPASGCASVPKICLDGDNCTVDACDPLTGSCVAPPVACPAGQNCNPADGTCAGDAPPCICNELVPGFLAAMSSTITSCSSGPTDVLLGTSGGTIFGTLIDAPPVGACGFFNGDQTVVTTEQGLECIASLNALAAAAGVPCTPL